MIAHAIGNAGAILGGIDLVRVDHGQVVRDITFLCADAAHGEAVVNAVRGLDQVEVDSVSDRTFLLHVGGKIEVRGKVPVKTRDDLSMAYTPGVARVCSAIHEDRAKAWTLTIKANTVAVVSDGSAVLGLGDIGPYAALLNALRVVGKRPEDTRVVIVGAGAAGVACAEIILAHGVRELLVADIDGVLYPGREGLDPVRAEIAERTNPGGRR